MFAPKNNTQTTSAKNSLFGGESDAFVQPKLSIGQPGDRYEVEADRAADQIVARDQHQSTSFLAPAPTVQRQTDEDVQKQELENEIQQKPVVDPITPGVQLKPLIQQQTEEEIQKKCSDCGQEETVQKKPEGAQVASGTIENQILSSKGGGSPMSGETRSAMESGFGADFSNVRIHTDSSAVQMNKSIGAQAFTSGNDIYFNEGKYNPNSTSGKHLLAHELTHTIQQGGSSAMAQTKIQMMPDWVNSAAGWVGDTASGVASGVADGAAWVGDQVASGAEWVGDQVADGAEWVGDQISAAASWVMDGINGAINSGTDFLNEKWDQVKEFGTSSFEDIKNGFGNLASFITAPMANMISAFSDLNADILEGAWNMLKSGGNALWTGINSLVQGVLDSGEAIWSSVTGFVNGIFDTISGFFNDSAFSLLPETIKNGIQSAFSGLQSLWDQVSSFWDDLWSRLTSFAQEIIDGALNFVENIINYGIAQVVSMVRGLKEIYDYMHAVFDDAMATITPYLQLIADKLDAESPGESEKIGMAMGQEHAGGQPSSADNGAIQTEMIAGEDRSITNPKEFAIGLAYYIKQAYDNFDFLEMIKDSFYNTYWPPALFNSILGEFDTLINDEWTETYNAMYTPRSFFEHPIGCLQDIWTNYLLILDFPNALHRRLNNIIGLLMGWIGILVIIGFTFSGATGGAVAGGAPALPGALIGFTTGLAVMSAAGALLSASVVIAEGEAVKLNLQRLFSALQTCEKRQIDIMSAVMSFIIMAVNVVLGILMIILSYLLAKLADVMRSIFKRPVPVAPPIEQPTIPVPGKPPALPPPSPIPDPTIPIRPPGRKPVPVPARPAAPGPSQPRVPMAAKFEDGTDVNLVAQRLEDESATDEIQTKEEQNNIGEPNTQVLDPMNIQMTRADNTNPDACENKEKDLPKTVVKYDFDSAKERPKWVEAKPLTWKPGDPPNSVGSPPKDNPAGWELVDTYKYFEAFIDENKPKGEGRQTRLIENTPANQNPNHPDHNKTRGYANKNNFPIYRTTDWVRFHMLNEKLHGPGLFWNLLSADGKDNSKYRDNIEDSVKTKVLKERRLYFFKIIVDDYHKAADMGNVHPDVKMGRKEVSKLYERIPKKLSLHAGGLEEVSKGVYAPIPSQVLYSGTPFKFEHSTINVSDAPGSQTIVILYAGRKTIDPGLAKTSYREYFRSQRGIAKTVDQFVNNYFVKNPNSSFDFLIEFLKNIVNALYKSTDTVRVTLLENGNTQEEIVQLQQHISDLLDLVEENKQKFNTYKENKRSDINAAKGSRAKGRIIKNVVAYGKTLYLSNSQIVAIFNDPTNPYPQKSGKLGGYTTKMSVIKNTKASDYDPSI